MLKYSFILRHGLILAAAAAVSLGFAAPSQAQTVEDIIGPACITDAKTDATSHKVELGIFRSDCDEAAAVQGFSAGFVTPLGAQDFTCQTAGGTNNHCTAVCGEILSPNTPTTLACGL